MRNVLARGGSTSGFGLSRAVTSGLIMVRKLQNSLFLRFPSAENRVFCLMRCLIFSSASPPSSPRGRVTLIWASFYFILFFWFHNPSVPHCRGCAASPGPPRLLHNHPPDSSSRKLKVSRCKDTLFFHHSWCLWIFVYFWPLLLTLKLLCVSVMTSLDIWFDDVRSNTVHIWLSVAVWYKTLHVYCHL